MADGGGINFTLNTNPARMENAIARVQRKADRLEARMRAMGNASTKAGNDARSSFRQMGESMVRQYLGAQGLITLGLKYNELLREQARLQLAASNRQLSEGQLDTRLSLALGGRGEEAVSDKRSFIAGIENLITSGKVTQFTPAELKALALEVVQATGGTRRVRAAQALEFASAADLFGSSKEGAGTGFATALQIAKSLGLEDKDVSPELRKRIINASLAVLPDIVSQSRLSGSENLGSFEKVVTAVAKGDTDDDIAGLGPEQRFERRFKSLVQSAIPLFAATTIGIADREGAESATFDTQVEATLRKLLPAIAQPDANGKIIAKAAQTATGDAIDTLAERMKAIQSEGAFFVDPVTGQREFQSADLLQRRFLIGAKGNPKIAEARTRLKAFLENLVKGEGQVTGQFADIAADLPGLSDVDGGVLDQIIAENTGISPAARAFRRQQSQESEAFDRTRNTQLERAGQIRALLFDENTGAFAQAGLGKTGSMFSRMFFNLTQGADPVAAAEAIVQSNITAMERSGGLPDQFGQTDRRSKEMLDMWRGISEKLDGIRKDQQTSNQQVQGVAAGAAAQSKGQSE